MQTAKAFVTRVPKPTICIKVAPEAQHIGTAAATMVWKDSLYLTKNRLKAELNIYKQTSKGSLKETRLTVGGCCL